MFSEQDANHCTKRLSALANDVRLRIFSILLEGEVSVTVLSERLNQTIRSISRHLGRMAAAQIVQSRRDGRHVYYSLHPSIVRANFDTPRELVDLGCCVLNFEPKESVAFVPSSKSALAD